MPGFVSIVKALSEASPKELSVAVSPGLQWHSTTAGLHLRDVDPDTVNNFLLA